MKRIQRKRIKGWRMPENTVYVGRPTKWGNPFSPKRYGRIGCIEMYRKWILDLIKYCPTIYNLDVLKGKNLACWCPLDQPCHADVLLHLANKGDSSQCPDID